MFSDDAVLYRPAAFALAALSTLILALALTQSAPAAGGRTAETAKKKCKKAKKSASAAKKKKCRKRVKPVVLLPPLPGSLTRAKLTWTAAADIDLDLWVWDATGASGKAASNSISGTSFSPESIGTGGAGSETFTDNQYVPGHRQFSYGICYQSGNVIPANFTLVYFTSDGVSHTLTGTLNAFGSTATAPDGITIPPPASWCHG